MIVAQLCNYTKTLELHILKRPILGHAKYISIEKQIYQLRPINSKTLRLGSRRRPFRKAPPVTLK